MEFYLTDVNDPSPPIPGPPTAQMIHWLPTGLGHELANCAMRSFGRPHPAGRSRTLGEDAADTHSSDGTYMFPERSTCPLTELLTLARKSATIIIHITPLVDV